MSESIAEQYGPLFLRMELRRRKSPKIFDSLVLEPQQIKEFTITLDINSFLPSFRLIMNDSEGILTHLTPFDLSSGRLHVSIGQSTDLGIEDTTDFSFDIYRRFPTSDFVWEVEGLLMVDDLFSPDKIRGFNETIQSTLETIAAELGVDSTEISASLAHRKTLIQPGWSNAKFLNYVKRNVAGMAWESGFFSFIKCVKTRTVFVFKSIDDFVGQSPKYRFRLGPEVYVDRDANRTYYPILEYNIVDNYRLLGLLGSRRQEYTYFDYTLGKPKIANLEVDRNSEVLYDFPSLTRYYQIDKEEDANDNITLYNTGRSNSLTSDFTERALGLFHKNLVDLSKMWIDTFGISDIYPGDIVEVQKIEHVSRGEEFGYQGQGYWIVEKVVHVVGHGYITRLLLTRNGTDFMEGHSLLPAANWKQ